VDKNGRYIEHCRSVATYVLKFFWSRAYTTNFFANYQPGSDI